MEQANNNITVINTPKYFFYCGVGGLLACGLTHAAFTPVDVVKCNAQVNPKEFTGTFQGFRYIYSGRAQPLGFPAGIKGLAKGWGPTLAGYSAQGLFKYGFYDFFKYKFAQMAGEENAHKYRDILYMSASASAEVIADIALCPFEAVKVRIQTTPAYARGMLDGLPKMVANEGFSNLYAGLVPLWGRQIPYTVIKFVAFEDFSERIYNYLEKNYKPKHAMTLTEQMGVVFTAGYAAGILCGTVSHPADTMVSKINKLKMDGSLMTKMRVIYYGTPEAPGIGFAGLWKGLGPRVFMIGTLTGLQWLIYGGFKAAMGLPTPGGAEKKK